MQTMDDSKQCSICDKEQLLTNFYRTKRIASGHISECKSCKKERMQKFLESPEKLKEHNERIQKWRLANPKKVLWIAAKARAKKQNLPFDITIDDFEIPQFCPVLGIEIKQNVGKISFHSPTLDKINPSKGYVKGNVTVISSRANTIKHNASYEEIALVAEWLRKVNS